MVSGPKSNEYVSTLGQPVATRRSSSPHRSSAATPGGCTRWVDMVSLGKAALSSNSTRWPWRASSIAVGEPAQRAPTTITSYLSALMSGAPSVGQRRPSHHRGGGGKLARLIALHGRPDEGHERPLVDLIALVEVDGAPGVAFEARVEQSGGVVQRGPLEERELHRALVRLAGADAAVVRPHRDPGAGRLAPLPLLDHVGIGLLDQRADPGQGVAPPVAQFLDLRLDQPRRRLPGALHGGNATAVLRRDRDHALDRHASALGDGLRHLDDRLALAQG